MSDRRDEWRDFIEQTKDELIKAVGNRFDEILRKVPEPDDEPEEDPRSRGKMAHHVKCWPRYFAQLWTGHKLAEVRVNDRDYQQGDYLVLREYDPAIAGKGGSDNDACTGRWMACVIVGVSDLDAVVAKNVVLLSLAFDLKGWYRAMNEHPLAQPFATNDAAYAALCVSTQAWATQLEQHRTAEQAELRGMANANAPGRWG